jgi:hypothetical protein
LSGISGGFFAATIIVTTLFAVWKSAGILLFASAIIYMFPQILEWVGLFFPTHYVLQPIIEISQVGADRSNIATNVFILIGMDIILVPVAKVALWTSGKCSEN